jgi:hypothetical protein
MLITAYKKEEKNYTACRKTGKNYTACKKQKKFVKRRGSSFRITV